MERVTWASGPGSRPEARAPAAVAGLLAAVTGLLTAVTALAACLQIGEPTPGAAYVTWATYPDTVLVDETFSFEFAGPVAPTACGRLDTAVVALTDSSIELSARRSTFRTLCAKQRVSFYEARPLQIPRAGRYPVRTAEGRRLGSLVAVDTGSFAPMRAVGLGTVETAGGCWLFGPGWMGNQRPFALQRAPPEVTAQAGTDRVVHVEGRLVGFTLCSWYGSRPTIRVDTAWATERFGKDYY